MRQYVYAYMHAVNPKSEAHGRCVECVIWNKFSAFYTIHSNGINYNHEWWNKPTQTALDGLHFLCSTKSTEKSIQSL